MPPRGVFFLEGVVIEIGRTTPAFGPFFFSFSPVRYPYVFLSFAIRNLSCRHVIFFCETIYTREQVLRAQRLFFSRLALHLICRQ